MPRLSLCMIVKNEEENLQRCLPTIVPHVSEFIAVDTGSTDNTRAVLTQWGASVYEYTPRTNPEGFFVDNDKNNAQWGAPPPYSGEIAFADFAAARNESFKHATGDFILWLDADDTVEGAKHLPAIVADLEARGLDFGFLAYDYARDHLGRVFYRQWRERIVRRDSADWRNAVHEVLLPRRGVTPVRYTQTKIVHHRKPDRPGIPNRNYKLLLRNLWQVKTANPDAPIDPRTLFYLGQEARFIEPLKAVGFYEEYLKSSGWPEERSAAHSALGQLSEMGALGLPPDEALARAERHYAVAQLEQHDNPDGYFGMARIAVLRKRWLDAVRYSEQGFKIGNTDSMLGANPLDRLYRPHVYYNEALFNLGRLDEAIESCKAGLAVCPDDPGVPGGAPGMLRHNLTAFEKEKQRQMKPPEKPALVEFSKNEDVHAPPASNIPRDALVIWAMQLWKQNMAANDTSRAQALLDALPMVVEADPVIEKMRQATRDRWWRRHDPLDAGSVGAIVPERGSVVIYTGPAFEPWDPTTPNAKGIGGSETAAIEMAREFQRLGYAVTVIGDCPGREGIYDSVRYQHHAAFTGADCDVFISSRRPDMCGPAIRARLKLLWVHDINVGPPSPQMERWLLEWDRILCLSQWHKRFFCESYPTLDPARVIVTRNGIDPERFRVEHPKTNRLIFSSSPNRGLDTLLHLFPVIRQHIPDAELHIYYGFDCWETFARQRGNQSELAEIQRYKTMIADAEQRGGVKWHGRVSQRELADAFMRSKVWAYPTLFHETSCITAMEAQAAGCVPVATRVAALAETVKHGTLIDLGRTHEQQQQAVGTFVAEVIRMLTDEPYRKRYADAGREWARSSLSWRALAEDWSQMFERLTADVERNPIAMWRSA
jgi:glycosyltransferase involved in cell wall biosynthesis/tetratricopeptide (TPR) repeat protein